MTEELVEFRLPIKEQHKDEADVILLVGEDPDVLLPLVCLRPLRFQSRSIPIQNQEMYPGVCKITEPKTLPRCLHL